MANDRILLGALVATQNITVDDAVLLAEYCEYADEIGADPSTIMSAVDLALDFFRPSPDEDERVTAEAAAVVHDPDSCPDCGGQAMDEVDIEQAIDVWGAIRGVVDKYLFDRESAEQEDC